MKNFFSKVVSYVVLPGLIVMALSSMLNPMVPNVTVPTVVISKIADSGERWYNPLSWKLDEAAEMAHSQAQEAATAATSAAKSFSSCSIPSPSSKRTKFFYYFGIKFSNK